MLKLNFSIHSISHFSVCACGKWTCTSEICIEGYRDIENRVHDDDGDWGDEDAEDPEWWMIFAWDPSGDPDGDFDYLKQ